jgi:thioredoxin
MSSRRIAILGCLLLGLLVVRYVVLNRYRPSGPHANSAALPYKEAAAKATQDHKLLLVDAMAQWCGPCKAMERDSWSSRDVQSWIDANAVFAQVDVDADPETAKALGIEAMPTIILVKDGAELKRSVGYLDAGELLEWLKVQ